MERKTKKNKDTNISKIYFKSYQFLWVFLTKEDKTRSFFFQSIYKTKYNSSVNSTNTFNTMANILAIDSSGPNGKQTSDSIDYDYDSEYDSDSESDYSDYDDDEDPYWELNDQGTYMPKKEDPLFIKRMIELEQDAQMEIAKLKTLLPNGTEKEDAISLLETFSVNDRYEDREKKEDKIDILIEKM